MNDKLTSQLGWNQDPTHANGFLKFCGSSYKEGSYTGHFECNHFDNINENVQSTKSVAVIACHWNRHQMFHNATRLERHLGIPDSLSLCSKLHSIHCSILCNIPCNWVSYWKKKIDINCLMPGAEINPLYSNC